MKKPTMKEVKQAIDNIIIHMSTMQNQMSSLDSALTAYIQFQKNEKKFNTWISKEMEKLKKAEEKDDKSTKTTRTSSKGNSKNSGKV